MHAGRWCPSRPGTRDLPSCASTRPSDPSLRTTVTTARTSSLPTSTAPSPASTIVPLQVEEPATQDAVSSHPGLMSRYTLNCVKVHDALLHLPSDSYTGAYLLNSYEFGTVIDDLRALSCCVDMDLKFNCANREMQAARQSRARVGVIDSLVSMPNSGRIFRRRFCNGAAACAQQSLLVGLGR